MSSCVLLTGPLVNAGFESPIASFDLDTNFIPEVLNPDVLDRIAEGAFDGVVCQADNGEALDCITRIRNRNSTVPIVVVSSHPDSEFERRARNSGATSVVAGNLAAAVVAENVANILKLKIAMQALTDQGRRNVELRGDLQDAVKQKQSLSKQRKSLSTQRIRQPLLPLLLESDPESAFRMVKAFEKAGVYAPLPIMKSVEEAKTYLQGLPPYQDRAIHPLPNILLIDLAPATSATEFVDWVRQTKQLVGLPIVLLSRAPELGVLQQACGTLVNSFLIKPEHPDELADLMRAIDHYWTRVNIGRLV